MSGDEAHPNDEALHLWLETERPNRVGQHLSRCEVCLSRLDVLSALQVEPNDGLGAVLAAAREVPEELPSPQVGQLRDRIADQEALSAVFDLFSVPWRMLDLVLNRHEPQERER